MRTNLTHWHETLSGNLTRPHTNLSRPNKHMTLFINKQAFNTELRPLLCPAYIRAHLRTHGSARVRGGNRRGGPAAVAVRPGQPGPLADLVDVCRARGALRGGRRCGARVLRARHGAVRRARRHAAVLRSGCRGGQQRVHQAVADERAHRFNRREPGDGRRLVAADVGRIVHVVVPPGLPDDATRAEDTAADAGRDAVGAGQHEPRLGDAPASCTHSRPGKPGVIEGHDN